jgi:hypothetical protein
MMLLASRFSWSARLELKVFDHQNDDKGMPPLKINELEAAPYT